MCYLYDENNKSLFAFRLFTHVLWVMPSQLFNVQNQFHGRNHLSLRGLRQEIRYPLAGF